MSEQDRIHTIESSYGNESDTNQVSETGIDYSKYLSGESEPKRRGRKPGNSGTDSDGNRSDTGNIGTGYSGTQKTKRVLKSQLVSPETLASIVAMLFLIVSEIRGKHWLKSEDDCLIAVQPLHSYLLNSGNKDLLKKVNKHATLFEATLAVIALFYNPIKSEIEIVKSKKINRQPGTGTGTGTVATKNGIYTKNPTVSESVSATVSPLDYIGN
jgi:hypothetical protein